MARKHILEGIIKWSQRGQWQEPFDELIEHHLGAPCDEMGIELPELPEILDTTDFMKLWGCVFEDLLTADIDGQNLAEDYLKRRGWKESAGARTLIRALRQSVMSLYEVSGIRRDEGFFLRDLVRGGGPFWVHEKLGTHAAQELDLLATRVLTINGRVEIGGVTLPFKRAMADELLEQLNLFMTATPDDMEAAFVQFAKAAGETIDKELGEVLDEIKNRKAKMTVDEMLAGSAFQFSDHWLRQILEQELERESERVDLAHRSPANQSQPANEMADDPENAEQYDLFGAITPKKLVKGKRR